MFGFIVLLPINKLYNNENGKKPQKDILKIMHVRNELTVRLEEIENLVFVSRLSIRNCIANEYYEFLKIICIESRP